MERETENQMVDWAMDAYLDWREECAEVWDAYERFSRAPVADSDSAFSGYQAALDREERAAAAYAFLVERIGVTEREAISLAAPGRAVFGR